MNKAKRKIILAAIHLFNEEGLSNVRNQDIAQRAGMSLSNFNYHYKNKRDLVVAVCDYMTTVLEEKVYGNKTLIMEGQGIEITKSYFEFEQDFRFFFLDTHNIITAYPSLKEALKKQVESAIQIIKNLNYLSIGKGSMKPEPVGMPGLYDQLAEQIWINNHFWFAQSNIREETGDIVLKGIKAVFSILYPYLTEKGIEAYQHYIGTLEGVESEG